MCDAMAERPDVTNKMESMYFFKLKKMDSKIKVLNQNTTVKA